MSKAVIASLKPYFYYFVGEGIKKIEVRKSEPKADDWNRETYFYMSKDEKSFAKIPKEYQDKYRKHFGKVGLKFMCDRIDEIFPCAYGTGVDIWSEFFISTERFCKKSCLTEQEIANYMGGKSGYGWHISDLKIYDKPKELSEFRTICEGIKCDGCEYYYVENNESMGLFKDCLCGCEKPIKRPPQSWCYCEE